MTNSTFFTKTVLKPARMAYSEIVELIPCWFFVYFHHFNIPLGSPPHLVRTMSITLYSLVIAWGIIFVINGEALDGR